MKKTIIILAILAGLIAFTACDDDNDYILAGDYTPQRPQGVFSVTGDEQVKLFWLPVEYDNLRFYRIWRNTDGGNDYYLYDTVLSYFDISVYEDYTDYNVENGETYYYAVTTYGLDGEESKLSYELVYDTPRPEGSGLILTDTAAQASTAGFDLNGQLIQPWNQATTDVFIDYDFGLETYFLNAAKPTVYIQDMGVTDSFEEISVAPADGYSWVGWQELIEYHTYVIYTEDGGGHYAKLRLTYADYDNGWVEFEWAFQEDIDNPQLIVPNIDENYGKRVISEENNNQPGQGL